MYIELNLISKDLVLFFTLVLFWFYFDVYNSVVMYSYYIYYVIFIFANFMQFIVVFLQIKCIKEYHGALDPKVIKKYQIYIKCIKEYYVY